MLKLINKFKYTKNLVMFNKEKILISSSFSKTLVRFLSILLPIWSIFYNLNLGLYLGINLFSGVYLGVFLAIVLIIVFQTNARWYDYFLSAAGCFACLYYSINYEYFVITGLAYITKYDIIISVICIIIILEAVRRTVGWAMVIVCAFFIIHANIANLFPSLLHGPKIAFDRAFSFMALSNTGIYGTVLNIAGVYVIAFTTFGAFLLAFGGGEIFTNLILSLTGRQRGGPAKFAVLGSCVLGTMTGCPVANVGITGTFSIPMMKRTGYSPEFAAAVESTASVGGIIMPPMMGAVVFVMMEFTGFSFVEMMRAAIIPAILYFYTIYVQISLYSNKYKIGELPVSEIPNKRESLFKSASILITLCFLIFLLVILFIRPVYAIYYSLGFMVLMFFIDKNINFSITKIFEALELSTKNVIAVVPVMAAAGIIISSVALTGIGTKLANNLIALSGESLLLLTILTALLCYLLGMGISGVISYIILASLVAPAMVQFGVPAIAAHFFIVYMGLSSFITPPYAVACLVASSIAGSKFFSTCFEAIKLAIVIFIVPITFVISPVLLFEGVTLLTFLTRIILSLIAIYILSVGLQGFFFNRNLWWWERINWFVGGLLLFFPNQYSFYMGVVFSIIAFIIFFAISKNKFVEKLSESK